MSRYIGKVTIKVNGTVLDSKPGASIDLGGVTRNEVTTDQDMGFSETPKPSRIECEMGIKATDSLEGLRNFTNGSAVFECDTGQRYIVNGAYIQDTLTVTGGQNGGVKLVIMGKPAQEMTS